MTVRRRHYHPQLQSAALLLALGLAAPALAGEVTLDIDNGPANAKPGEAAPAQPAEDASSTDWSRKLWTGSFDRAADASGAAAKQLDNLDFGECKDYLQPSHNYPSGNQTLYQACLQRSQQSKQYAGEARSIQKQQNVMSLVSKASDVAAVGAVAGVAYAELGAKKKSQSDTYSSAANIERTAGQVSYATGAADLTMGAYAYVAQKHKLEEIESQVSGTSGGVKASSDPAVKSALISAVEAAKKAAYSHMMWGAGKLAAGYGMMYLAKQSQTQAANMESMQEEQAENMYLQQQLAAQNAAAAQQAAVATNASAQPPFYQNENPVFTLPNSGTSALAPLSKTGTTGTTAVGSSTGASKPLDPSMMRAPASAAAKGGGGLSGSGGGAGGAGGGGAATSDDAAPAATKDKATKEALGSSFELQLNGGVKAFSGNSAASGAKDDVPNLAALMGAGGAGSAATGLNPAQIFRDAQEGTEGTDQGSMAGVSGKGEISLFDITRAKLTKMFQTGNVGVEKNVEVRN